MQVQFRETMFSQQKSKMSTAGRETIHSGQFMVSHFEAEEQDDDEHSVAVPEPTNSIIIEGTKPKNLGTTLHGEKSSPQIDSSLAKLFQCMSLAYRQKLTSPKWNRFKGIRLRWKDKIRLNNVIWRCWHMQFIMKQNSLVCQFASPLDVDTHNKPEAVVLEGKYWKRKLAAVTAEYKKWRMFSRNRVLGYGVKDTSDLPDIEFMEWGMPPMLVDDDYMQLMSDTLFSTISNQAFAFPDSREIARGAGLADFIQPSLGPLQPNLEDYMDTLQPLQDLLGAKLAPVPEEMPMETNASNNVQPEDTYMNSYGMVNMNSSNYNVSHFIGNSSTLVTTRPSAIRSKSANNELLPVRDLNSYTGMSYNSYPMSNISPQMALHMPMISNQHHINQAPLINTDSNLHTNNMATLSTNLSNIQSNMNINSLVMQNNIPNIMPSDFSNQSHTVTTRQTAPKITPNMINNKTSTDTRHKTIVPHRELNKTNMPNSQNNAIPTSPVNLPFYRNTATQQNYKILANTISEQNRSVNNKKQSAKEMFRSNSLPLNSSLQLQDDLFLVPRSSMRQNAMQQNTGKLSPLVSAVSDPSLHQTNALLAQLLTNNKSSQSCIMPNNNINMQQSQRLTNQNGLVTPGGAQLMSSHSPQSESAPLSPEDSLSPVGMNSRAPPRETRRAGHIHAEQKRRYNIKNGFDVLHSLIPHLQQNPTNKLSKAAMLQKGADYIKQLQLERKSLEDEIMSLKNQAETLNSSISNCQSMLPATGAPVSRQRTGRIREMFREYVYARTLEDWKFWIFSLLVEPLLLTFNSAVSTVNMQELCRTTIQWVDQHCSLVDLRPGVLNALRLVCTTTDILAHPERLPEQARNAVMNSQQQY